jgi:hypothetical protein
LLFDNTKIQRLIVTSKFFCNYFSKKRKYFFINRYNKNTVIMFTKFEDFLNESKKINKEFENEISYDINEGFSAEKMGKALGLIQKIIARKLGAKVSNPNLYSARCEYITSIDSRPRFGVRMVILTGEKKDGLRFSWVGTSNGLNEIYEFSVFSSKDTKCVFWDKPTVTVGVKDFNTVRGLGIGYILTAAINCVINPFSDVTPQDFVKSALNESQINESQDDFDFGNSGNNEVSYEILDENVTDLYSHVNEARTSALTPEELARKNLLFKKGKKQSTPEEWSEFLALKAASATGAYFANTLEEVIRGLKEQPNGVNFRFTKKSDGSVRRARGTTDIEIVKSLGGKIPAKEHVPTENDPVITYFDMDLRDWRSFTKSALIAKQVSSPSKPARKERLLSDSERQRLAELNLRGKRKMSPSERAEYDQLMAKSKGIENFIQSAEISVSNIRNPKEKDLLLAEQISRAEKLMAAIKSTGDEQFERLERNVLMMTKGRRTSLLITGQAGVGKTYTVGKTLESVGLRENVDWFSIEAKATTAGVYQALYRYRDKITVFDDIDAVFRDEDTVNVLKAALDSKKVRKISWLSSSNFVTDGMTQDDIHREFKAYEESGKPKYPQSFEYTGGIIFISNLPMEGMDKALMSRSTTIDITLTPDEMRERIVKLLPKIEMSYTMEIKEAVLSIFDELIAEDKISIMDFRTFLKALATYEFLDDLGAPREKIKKEIIIECVNYFSDVAILKSKKR